MHHADLGAPGRPRAARDTVGRGHRSPDHWGRRRRRDPYASLDVSNAAGLLLQSRYEGEEWQLMPLALELTTVHEHVGRDGEQRELGAPDFAPASEAGAKCEALNDALQAADDG